MVQTLGLVLPAGLLAGSCPYRVVDPFLCPGVRGYRPAFPFGHGHPLRRVSLFRLLLSAAELGGIKHQPARWRLGADRSRVDSGSTHLFDGPFRMRHSTHLGAGYAHRACQPPSKIEPPLSILEEPSSADPQKLSISRFLSLSPRQEMGDQHPLESRSTSVSSVHFGVSRPLLSQSRIEPCPHWQPSCSRQRVPASAEDQLGRHGNDTAAITSGCHPPTGLHFRRDSDRGCDRHDDGGLTLGWPVL